VSRCEVCQVRKGPCVDAAGAPIAQWHVARVRAASAARVGDYAAEGARLRADAKAGRP
jgi:hypothetical protein